MSRNPYEIIKHQHNTEKAKVLLELKDSESNRSASRCKTPKYVFVVDPRASKQEIAHAVEEIYKEQNIKVIAVNTINVKGRTRRVRGRIGQTKSFKKAIVTLEEGDTLDNV